MSIQQIRDQAREAVHAKFADAAIYRAPDQTVSSCTVRRSVATLMSDVGDLGGLSGIGNAGFASTAEREYICTFLRREVTPQRGGVIEFDDGMSFRIERVHRPYGITISVDVELLTYADL